MNIGDEAGEAGEDGEDGLLVLGGGTNRGGKSFSVSVLIGGGKNMGRRIFCTSTGLGAVNIGGGKYFTGPANCEGLLALLTVVSG